MSQRPDSCSQPDARPFGDSADSVLADCLALLAQNDPDFATVAQAWSELPEPIRAAIVAMVKAARP